jgi:hypothetical protein
MSGASYDYVARCPRCDSGNWEVVFFDGDEHSAVEGRKCQDCGHSWSEVLTA